MTNKFTNEQRSKIAESMSTREKLARRNIHALETIIHYQRQMAEQMEHQSTKLDRLTGLANISFWLLVVIPGCFAFVYFFLLSPSIARGQVLNDNRAQQVAQSAVDWDAIEQERKEKRISQRELRRSQKHYRIAIAKQNKDSRHRQVMAMQYATAARRRGQSAARSNEIASRHSYTYYPAYYGSRRTSDCCCLYSRR